MGIDVSSLRTYCDQALLEATPDKTTTKTVIQFPLLGFNQAGVRDPVEYNARAQQDAVNNNEPLQQIPGPPLWSVVDATASANNINTVITSPGTIKPPSEDARSAITEGSGKEDGDLEGPDDWLRTRTKPKKKKADNKSRDDGSSSSSSKRARLAAPAIVVMASVAAPMAEGAYYLAVPFGERLIFLPTDTNIANIGISTIRVVATALSVYTVIILILAFICWRRMKAAKRFCFSTPARQNILKQRRKRLAPKPRHTKIKAAKASARTSGRTRYRDSYPCLLMSRGVGRGSLNTNYSKKVVYEE